MRGLEGIGGWRVDIYISTDKRRILKSKEEFSSRCSRVDTA